MIDYFQSSGRARHLLVAAQEIASSNSIEEAMQSVVIIGRQELSAQTASAWIAPGGGKPRAWAQYPTSQNVPFLGPETLEVLVMTLGIPLVYTQADMFDSLPAGPLPEPVGPYLGVPITIGSEIVGGITFGRTEGAEPFDETDTALIEYLAAFLAVGISQSQMLSRAKRAEEARQMQSDYLATVSHDIRSPLTAIIGAIKLLEKMSTPEAKTFVEMGLRGTEHIERLVSSLLDMSRIESGNLPLHPTVMQIGPILERTNNLLDHPYTLNIKDDPTVLLDPQRVEQIILNLMTNGKKYGEDPRNITLEKVNNKLRLTVQDHGPGLPQNIQDHLGERYLPSVKGIGLGLAIIVAMTEIMNGTIKYLPLKPQGAQFVLEFQLY